MRYIILTNEDKLQGLGVRLETAGDFVLIISGTDMPGKAMANCLPPGSERTIAQLVEMLNPNAFIVDNKEMAKDLEELRSFGIPIIGVCEFSDILEDSSAYFKEVCKRVGLKTDNNNDGIKFDIEGWWDGKDLKCCSLQFMFDRMMNDNLGIKEECFGVVLQRVERNNVLVLETIAKLKEYLESLTYLGPVKISARFLETSIICDKLKLSFSFDSLPTQCELLPCNISKFFSLLVEGKLPVELDSDYAVGVRVSFPPYPVVLKLKALNKVEGLLPEKLSHFWPYKVRDYREDGTCMSSDLLGVVTAHGGEVRYARKRAVVTLEEITGEGIQYRTDIGWGTPTLFGKVRIG